MMKLMVTVTISQMLLLKSHMLSLMMIIFSSILMASFNYMSTLSYWENFLIIFIFISGIMVLFMFIISLAPNEKSKVKNFKKSLVATLMMSMLSMTIFLSGNSKGLLIQNSYTMNISTLMLITTVILMTAMVPPKLVLCQFKGMKTTK